MSEEEKQEPIIPSLIRGLSNRKLARHKRKIAELKAKIEEEKLKKELKKVKDE